MSPPTMSISSIVRVVGPSDIRNLWPRIFGTQKEEITLTVRSAAQSNGKGAYDAFQVSISVSYPGWKTTPGCCSCMQGRPVTRRSRLRIVTSSTVGSSLLLHLLHCSPPLSLPRNLGTSTRSVRRYPRFKPARVLPGHRYRSGKVENY